jgi:hypothetical protein
MKTGIEQRNRRGFIGGSDARIIMGNDAAALIHLWQEAVAADNKDLRSSPLGTVLPELCLASPPPPQGDGAFSSWCI